MTRPVEPEERAARFIALEVHESTHDRLKLPMKVIHIAQVLNGGPL